MSERLFMSDIIINAALSIINLANKPTKPATVYEFKLLCSYKTFS